MMPLTTYFAMVMLFLFYRVCMEVVDWYKTKDALPTRWTHPADLTNDDKAWLNSQFELADATQCQIPIEVVPTRPSPIVSNRAPRRGVTKTWTGTEWVPVRSTQDTLRVQGYLYNLETKTCRKTAVPR